MTRLLRFAPLAFAVLLVGALVWRLANPPDTAIESEMVGKPVPGFVSPAALPGKPGLGSADFADGHAKLVNFFASWCVPCVGEAPMLTEIRKQGVTIDGIAIRDRADDLRHFFDAVGDPFDRIGSDPQSKVQLEFGSAGVPETFVVDGHGIIRMQHIGPIEPGDVPDLIDAVKAAQ